MADTATKKVYGGVPHVISHNTYKDYEYFVINNTVGPCAYVVLNTEPDWDVFDLDVHGGITYYEKGLKLSKLTCKGNSPNNYEAITLVDESKLVIGWDYMHAYDYLPHLYLINTSVFNGEVWTENELEIECFKAIDEILKKNLEYSKNSVDLRM